MTELILVRHGRTAWNKEPRFRGQADIPLDEADMAQARATAERLSEYPVAAVYSSPLIRAMATAQPIAQKQGIKVQPHNGLIDINFGKLQGLPPQQVREQDADLLDSWLKTPHKVTFPDGESLNDVRDRFTNALNELTARHANETVVLLSHMVALKVALCVVLGLDNSHFWQIAQNTCAINIVSAENGNYIIKLINDTCHLNQ